MLNLKEQQRSGWIDILRIIACIMVVVGHCCDPYVASWADNYQEFQAGAYIGSLVRASVPLFAMLTAVLLLPVKETLTQFYKKRIKRVGVALVFWSIASPIIFFLYTNFINPSTIHPYLAGADYSLATTLKKFYTLFFNFNYETLIYWYIYMLIGLYLILPIVSAWLDRASKKELKTVLGVWGISTFVPYIQVLAPMVGYTGNGGNMGLYGVCDWNPFGSFYYLSGFIGYMILAYYLKKYPMRWSWAKALAWCVPMFLVGYAITLFCYLKTNELYPGDFPKLEIIWFFCSPNVVLMTLSLFLLGQKITINSSPWIARMGGLMFGVYLVHFIFVHVAYDLLYLTMPVNPFLQILVMGVASFVVTLGVCYLICLTKVGRKVMM